MVSNHGNQHFMSESCIVYRPSVLDSFSATVGHFSTLLKQLASDKTPPLSNRVIIPLQVSSERDPELEVLYMFTPSSSHVYVPLQRSTENRLSMLHHEVGETIIDASHVTSCDIT